MGVPRRGHQGRPLQPVARPLRVRGAQRGGEVGVVRDRRARVGVRRAAVLDHPPGPVVQPHPACGTQLGVQRLACERVHEHVARVLVLDQPAGQGEVEVVQALVDGRVDEHGHEVRVDGPAEDRSRGERAHDRLRQALDPLAQDVADAVGHGQGGRFHVLEVGYAGELAGVLQDEERVAARDLGDERVELGVVLADRCGEQPTDRGVVESVQTEPLGACLSEHGEGVDERITGRGLGGASRAQHRDRHRDAPDLARWRSSCSEVLSAQWMSSRTSSSGRADAARATRSTTASNIRSPVPAAGVVVGDLALEQRDQQWVHLRALAERPHDRQPRPQRRGVVALVAPADQTRNPACVAASPTSATSLDLPMPGSPATSRKRRLPVVRAASTRATARVEHRGSPDGPGRSLARDRGRWGSRCRPGWLRPDGGGRDDRGDRGDVSAGSCRSTASSSCRISSDGSTPSSSASRSRRRAQGVEGVGLAGALVLRQCQQRPQPLAVGMLRSQLGESAQRLVRSAQVDQRAGPQLLQGERAAPRAGWSRRARRGRRSRRTARPTRPHAPRPPAAVAPRPCPRPAPGSRAARRSTCRRRPARPPASSRPRCSPVATPCAPSGPARAGSAAATPRPGGRPASGPAPRPPRPRRPAARPRPGRRGRRGGPTGLRAPDAG